MKPLKNYTKHLLVCFIASLSFFNGHTQCMQVPISLDERLQQSSQIVEAVIVNKIAKWDNLHRNIYTVYTIAPTLSFKGNTTNEVNVIVIGGKVGDKRLTTTDSYEMEIGDKGLFSLTPSNKPITTDKVKYDMYAGMQGYINYDPATGEASGTFDNYSNQAALYNIIEQKSGTTKTTINRNQMWKGSNVASVNQTGRTMGITTFSPSSLNAGNGEVLTITGSGFGTSRGSSNVEFLNANNGGSGYTTSASNDYVSWTDTEIKVKVPSYAGTGVFRLAIVVSGVTSYTSSGTSLTINYSLQNTTSFNTSFFAKLSNVFGQGGYYFRYSDNITLSTGSQFSNATNFKTYFENSVESWNCNSGVALTVGTNTTTNTSYGSDGICTVAWDYDDVQSVGTLGACYVWTADCSSSSSNLKGSVSEIDFVMNEDLPTGYSWYFGTGTPSATQYDFQSVVLHELGHGDLLGHVINTSAMMHYALTNGTTRRTFAPAIEVAGGQQAVALSTASTGCSGYPVMKAYTCVSQAVTLTASSNTLVENGGSTVITASIPTLYYKPVTVNITYSGTATGGGTDYSTTQTTSIIIPVGSTQGTATITSVTDALYEGNETIILDIASVTNGTESGTQQQIITITDDESIPNVTLSTGATSISETSGTTTIVATLSGASGLATTVNLLLTGTATLSTDYTLSSSIIIPAGSLSASITLSSISDALDENDETVIIDISSVTNATENGTQQKTVTIIDDDATPTVTLTTSGTSFFESGFITGGLTYVNLSATSGLDVTVTLSVSGTATYNTDYTLPLTVTIPAGSTQAQASTSAIDDALDEDNETIIIDIASVTNATENGTQQKSWTIFDDDAAPSVTLSYNNSSIGEAATSISTYTATLSAVSGKSVTVNLAMSNTATYNVDYSMSTLSIVILAGSTTGTATLTVIPDALYETNEFVTADISSVTNGTENGTQQKTLTINDDDPAPSVTLSSTALSIAELGGSTTITVTLSAVSGLATTINLATSGTATVGTDYTLSATSIVIPAGSTTGSVTITAISDIIIEGNETAIIDISTVVNGVESTVQQKIITIVDNVSVLPIHFESFTGIMNNCQADLTFATAFEQNNNRFEIEWSVDGLMWTNFATVLSKGNSNITQTYKSTHTSLSVGNNYYRIKQIDNDGKISYSNIVIVKSNCNDAKIIVAPNPFVNQVKVSGITNTSTIKILDAKGSVIIVINQAINTSTINTTSLARGNYYLQVIDDKGNNQTFSLVK
jgi:Calx-beta domain/IPT/TIG domain